MGEEERSRARERAEWITEELMRQQEELIAYFVSLDAPEFNAASSDRRMAVSVAQRLVDVLSFYQPDSELAQAYQLRVDSMRSTVERKTRDLIDLGSVEF